MDGNPFGGWGLVGIQYLSLLELLSTDETLKRSRVSGLLSLVASGFYCTTSGCVLMSKEAYIE